MMDHAPEINLYMEYETRTAMDTVLQLLRAHRVTIQDMEITRPSGSEDHRACAIFSLRFNRGVSHPSLPLRRIYHFIDSLKAAQK